MKNLLKSVKGVAVIALGVMLLTGCGTDNKEVVQESLNNYYESNKTEDLKPILDLLDKNKSKGETLDQIHNYADEEVSNWFVFVDSKYLCDTSNKMACISELNDIQQLLARVQTINNYKSEEGYTVLSSTSFASIVSENNKKISDLKSIISDNNAKSPLTSSEELATKCKSSSISCSSCYSNSCTCTYKDSTTGVTSTITCPSSYVSTSK